ncbi:NAD(P)-binding domain-containing protein [Catellatospora sp. NPDC049609]|uniref:NAD(P)-binding domain-containing protein n=1 Tax=Catellatospora sp. NPDC049609 TaxID=3155505 RepID=UPI003437FB40
MNAHVTGVCVVGLGPMGVALARALIRGAVPTTVWNRTPARAAPLAGEGATVAAATACGCSRASPTTSATIPDVRRCTTWRCWRSSSRR